MDPWTEIARNGKGATYITERIDLAYDAAGAFAKIDRYADQAAAEHVASTHYSYDEIGRLTKLLHTEGAVAPASGWGTDALAGYQYAYDAASRIASIDSYLDGLTAYIHDDTDQLTGADHTGQTDESYTYDANGNRTMTGHTVGDNNQLLSDGTYNYTYDDEGNRSTKTKISTGEKEEFAWDHRNRMANVTFKNIGGTITKTVEQSYDVFNRWVRRSVDPDGATGSAALVDTFFSWEANQINLQFDGSAASDLAQRNLWNPTAVDHIFAVEDVASLVAAGVIKWAFTDHLGTPRDIASYDAGTDETTIANHRVINSYGVLVSETNASFTIAVGFTGVYFDITTGLNYHRNRWYDPLTGQWTAEDPIVFFGGDTNLRRMVGNSPTNHTDPTGLAGIGTKNHVYPLYLGGDPKGVGYEFDCTDDHSAFHDYLSEQGFNKNKSSEAREAWIKLTEAERKQILADALRAGKVSEGWIEKNMDDVMKRAEAGSNKSPERKRPILRPEPDGSTGAKPKPSTTATTPSGSGSGMRSAGRAGAKLLSVTDA